MISAAGNNLKREIGAGELMMDRELHGAPSSEAETNLLLPSQESKTVDYAKNANPPYRCSVRNALLNEEADYFLRIR